MSSFANELKTVIIEANRVCYYYHDKKALDELSFTVCCGQHIIVLGSNGSGKSTIAKHFNALLQPNSGTVIVANCNTQDHDYIWELRKKVGMVFQNPENQIVGATVEDDIVFGMENIGLPRAEMQRRLENVINIMGLQELRYKEPHQLSGGQKQRVAIAGILAMEPDIIVFDEATSMLDPEGRREVLAAIASLKQTTCTTVIQITHDMEEALYADDIIVMAEGKLMYRGRPEEIFVYENNLETMGLQYPFAMRFARHISSRTNTGLGLECFEHSIPKNIDELVDCLCKSNLKM